MRCGTVFNKTFSWIVVNDFDYTICCSIFVVHEVKLDLISISIDRYLIKSVCYKCSVLKSFVTIILIIVKLAKKTNLLTFECAIAPSVHIGRSTKY